MGIDPIGKGLKVPPSPAAGETAKPATTENSFAIRSPSSPDAVGAVEAPRSLPDQVRAGTLSVEAYVETKVLEATAHLRALPAAQLKSVRSLLRERMTSDPTFVELVRTATGVVPEPRSQ